ncbi:hypothetical protein LTR37_017987 [Vermiconidia calcicola]|uniref:Uncharacterized protein n=1 Tax=Vermiconidia calcicola TaxID=1690605 RepID=A0ACC3ML77_9PEZI|nr:hypothetical protein LTR37_017987 [Vermiconidia calcicola]
MGSGLEDCPNEVVESTTVLLDLKDICTLRLVSRTLASAATQNHFKSYFRSKRVELTEAALQAFVEVTRCGRLGCAVQNLTLVGIARQSDLEASDEAKRSDHQLELHVKLLSQALTSIKASNGSGRLSSLFLEIAVILADGERILPDAAHEDCWRVVWQSTADTSRTVLRSLGASKLRIQSLNTFNGCQMQRCSLACDKLSSTDLKPEELSESFAGLTTLSLSLSNRIIEDVPFHGTDWSPRDKTPAIHEAEAKAADEHNFDGLEQLLQLSTQLMSLEMHYYRLDCTPHLFKHSKHHERLVQRLAKTDGFPRLMQCRLRGLHARDEDLLRLIQQTAARDLSLENITLTAGNFDAIFEHCTSEAAGIERLYIDDLFAEQKLLWWDPCGVQKLLYFDGVGSIGKPHVPLNQRAGRTRSSNTLKRAGAEISQNMSYHYHEGGPTMDTAQTRKWRHDRYREYGWGQVQPPFLRNPLAYR